jgi:hypothetical protein
MKAGKDRHPERTREGSGLGVGARFLAGTLGMTSFAFSIYGKNKQPQTPSALTA